MLAAKRTADARRDCANPRHRLAELLGDALLHVVYGLAGDMERDAPGRVDVRHAAVRLQVDVMLRLRLPRPLDDDVALGERAVHVTLDHCAFEQRRCHGRRREPS